MIDLNGKKIIILGGTGSFGTAMLDYLKDKKCYSIVFSRDENKQHEMHIARKNENIDFIIGDVRDKNRLIYAMKDVDYCFIASALKHVPTGENFPMEVINTNTIGVNNAIEAAEFCGVKKTVLISTDKSVSPSCGYGMTKGLAERIVVANSGNTINVCLRYGNVLGSRGSVVPLFLGMIECGEPLTITDPNMTRFIVTLNEAVRLAMKCLADGVNGDLFIMKPPACSIKTLVEALELHFNRKLPTKIIGRRVGEKMHEALLSGDEVYRADKPETVGNITFVRISAKHTKDFFFEGMNYEEPEPYTSDKAEQYDAQQVLNKLKEAKLL
jgi:UDP-N-acetylglucosamine 4,6-dehydratase/5-epimerase